MNEEEKFAPNGAIRLALPLQACYEDDIDSSEDQSSDSSLSQRKTNQEKQTDQKQCLE